MMTGLTHESRNALQRSQACLERLTWKLQGQPDALDLVARMRNAQEDLLHLYEDVRTYAGPITLDRNPCNLAEVWREAWDELTSQTGSREVCLQEERNGVNLWCSVDRFRLRQVFRNILENALAACGDPVQIVITCREADLAGRPALEVAVRDNGPGLDPEQEARIFEPFYTTKARGTGLGMAIAKGTVEAHGGRIEAAIGHRPGAEIRLTLPRSAT
jgi:signal transduction histidine kinase